MQDPLYKLFDNAKVAGFQRFDEPIPAHITDNLSKNINLRPYQIEALNRYFYYSDNYQNRVSNNINLLFNMATGSGKTVIMAALILDLYRRGYSKFVFFVNRKTIVQKTLENFTNPASNKYLFAESISIDGQTPSISAVETLNSSDNSDIQILFTTVQGLHNDLFTPREGHITLEDMLDEKIVMLSDEAHHINAWTINEKLTKDEDIEKTTWEHGIRKIFHQNADNILLEFTATIDIGNINIANKYNDIILYKYDLKEFRNDKYSKDIYLYNVSDDIEQRILQAILISQYRLLIAENHGLLLKPVILFKSKIIIESEANEKIFHNIINSLNEDVIQKALGAHEVLQGLAQYLKSKNISLAHFINELKIAFDVSRIRNVNNEDQAQDLQIEINRLEDEDNEIRVIFAVDKLNEGWDVLNLFDIVRLYQTRDGKYNRGGEYIPGKTTTSEAQLIGRGARYWPFLYENEPVDQRKFDKDLTNELRLLEELFYHSLRDTDYLIEIRTALVKSGMMDQKEPKTVDLKFKDSFKQESLYRDGYVYANLLQDNPHSDKKTVMDYLQNIDQIQVKLSTKFVDSTSVFDDTTSIARDDNAQNKAFKFSEIPHNIVTKALDRRYKFYSFSNLHKYLPLLASRDDFIDMLGKINIKVSGSSEELFSPNPNVWLKVCDDVMSQIQDIITKTDTPRIGSDIFKPLLFKNVFKEKKILVEQAQGSTGVAMGEESDALFLDLSMQEWYVYKEEFGDSYEKRLIKLIDQYVDVLRENWDELFIVRNERDLKLYDFDSDGVFMPDYLLFLKREGKQPVTYYVFMEPKGEDIEAGDRWKENFLLNLGSRANVVDELGISQPGIKIIGLNFYQPSHEGEFADKLLNAVQ